MKKQGKSDFFERVTGEIVSEAGSYVKTKIIKWGEFSILVLLALIMISIGVATLIGHFFPEVNNGLNFILLGMTFLILSIFVKM